MDRLENVDLEGLKNLAERLAKCLKGNEIILLKGDLGSGKTTFTRYLVGAIDSSLEDEVNSPTFTIMNVYEGNRFNIYHIDLYRAKEFDVSDIVGNGVVIIEWAKEKEFENVEQPVVILNFSIGDDIDLRNIEIKVKNGDYIKKCIRGD